MFDADRVVKSCVVAFDQAGRTHVARIRQSLGLRSDDEAVAWALGIAAGRMPTMTQLKARRVNFPPASAVDGEEVERFPAGLLER